PMLECIVGYQNLQGKVSEEAANQKGDFERAARRVIWEDRKCPKWQQYNVGKSIQQYYLEDFMQRLEELRQKFQHEGEERQRAFAASQAETIAKLQEQTNQIVNAILATTKVHKEITEKSKTVAEKSSIAVTSGKEIAEKMKDSAEASDRFVKRMTRLI